MSVLPADAIVEGSEHEELLFPRLDLDDVPASAGGGGGRLNSAAGKGNAGGNSPLMLGDDFNGGEDQLVFTCCYRLWKFIPLGQDVLRVRKDGRIHLTRRRGCCCSCFNWSQRSCSLAHILAVQESKLPFTAIFGLLTIIGAFALAFLLHLVVAQIVTVPVSLGSSSTHRALGAVWGAFWVAGLIGLPFLRQRVVAVSIDPRSPGNDPSKSGTMVGACLCLGSGSFRVPGFLVSAASSRQAASLVQLLSAAPNPDGSFSDAVWRRIAAEQQQIQQDPQLRKKDRWDRQCSLWTGWLIMGVLLANMAVIGILLSKCMDCGGCSDDGPPRSGCYP